MCFHVWLIIIKVDFKNHKKTHSYTEAKFKCQNCYFVGYCSECGLSEIKFGNYEDLKTHL